MTPVLTGAGKQLQARGLSGAMIKFTKIALGNGPYQDAETAVALNSKQCEKAFDEIKRPEGASYVTLTTGFDNHEIANGFHVTEIGIYAEDPDGGDDILYGLGNCSESSADFIPSNSDRLLEMALEVFVFVGNAQNVAAEISQSLVYATKEAFEAHENNQSNPHGVTKEQVGLGNVPNVATNDQTPTYSEATALANIESGEALSSVFGKVKKAISSLIAHIGSRVNPHNVTVGQIGAAAEQHTHSATDINAGILPVERGGTGVGSDSALTELIKTRGDKHILVGTYTGNGEGTRTFRAETLVGTPLTIKAVMVGNAATANGPAYRSIALPGSDDGYIDTASGLVLRTLLSINTDQKTFTVHSGSLAANKHLNAEGYSYSYIILYEEEVKK